MFTTRTKRMGAFIMLFATLNLPIQASFYQVLGEMTLQAEASLKQAKADNLPDVQLWTTQEEKKKEEIDLTVTVPSKTEELALWFKLMNQTSRFEPQNRLATNDVVEKLNLLSGSGSDKSYCVRNLFPTQTTVGKAGAAEELALCTNGQRNQNVIRHLVENPNTAQRIKHALKKIDDGMGLYLTFFKELSEAERETFNKVFFGSWIGSTGANKSVIALAGLRTFQRGWNAICFTPFLSIMKRYMADQMVNLARGLKKIPKKAQSEMAYDSVKDGFLDNIIGHYPGAYSTTIDKEAKTSPQALLQASSKLEFPVDFSMPYDKEWLNYESKKRYWSLTDNIRWAHDSKINQGMLLTSYAFADLVHGYCAYNAAQNVQFDNTILNNLQTRLIGVASVIEGLVELNKVAQNSGVAELKELAREINELLSSMNGPSDLGSLLNHLRASTFKGETSYWSNRPRILATYTLLQENKVALIPALHAAGKLDALQAAATLYNQQAGQNAEYCFVEFVKNDTPIIDLQNFWNPLINPNKVVLNSVNLGAHGDRNMLLTGPNGSGKSGNMTGIALSGIILPHAFGIAAAQSARITPFTHVNTYLNEREDLQQDLSTFMAEAKKLDAICKQISELKSNEKCFTIMDEMLKGTVEEAGAQRVYEAGLKLAQQPQSICIMATHFEKPTDLEADTNGGFVNYHVGLVEPTPGEFKRTFELVRGANLWWFKDAAKRSRFINWLTSLNQ